MALPEASAEVLVATTWHCNLACSYCFVEDRRDGVRGRMTPRLAERLIKSLNEGLAEADEIVVHLYGGEPLTNLPAMRVMVEAAHAYPSGRFRFSITTNGTIASDEAIALLDRGQFEIVLSIDGPASVHDACRRTAAGRPSHQRVMRFLSSVRSRTGCRIRGSAVVRSGNSLKSAVDYLKSLPLDAIKAQAVRVPGGAPFALDDEERRAYERDLEAIGDSVIEDLESGIQPMDDRFSGRVLQMLAGRKRERFCSAGARVFGVTPEGVMLPCVLLDPEADALGRLEDSPSVWVEAGKRWREERAPRSECRVCDALPYCGGGCPAVLPVCGTDECDLIRKNVQVARRIYDHFEGRQTMLLGLAGMV